MHPQTIKDMFTKGPPCLIFPVSTASWVSGTSTFQLEGGVSCHQMSNYLVIYFHSSFVIHHLIFYLIKQAKSTISWKVISIIPPLQLSILGLSLSKHLRICHGRTKQQAKLNPWSITFEMADKVEVQSPESNKINPGLWCCARSEREREN